MTTMLAMFEAAGFSASGAGAGVPLSGPLRVRQILDGIGATGCRTLKKHLPADLPPPPADETAKYPNALLNFFPKPEQYSLLGVLAEHMLTQASSITLDALIAALPMYHPTATPAEIAKVRTSKTTQPFIDLLIATRAQMDTILAASSTPLRGESILTYDQVVGHPDARTDTTIFEIKLTGQLVKNWNYFILQTFAYAALDPAVTMVCIVLPLQKTVWRCDV